MRPSALPEASRRARRGIGIAIVSTALLGAMLYQSLYVNRNSLTAWANRLINSSSVPFASAGLSEESRLGSMFGRSDNYDRVLRIHTPTSVDISYMRAYSMYTLQGGIWSPAPHNAIRTYTPVSEADLQSGEEGTQALVFRYLSNRGLVLAPLNAVSIGISGTVNLRWAKDQGGPVRFDMPGPDTYTMTIGAPNQQGLFCEQPTADQLQELLSVPRDMDSRTRGLAATITAGITDPMRKARAIEAYLPLHHGYSQRFRVNDKDPLGDFLFSTKSAHCEFFASAAVVLMRCAGIPARYVVGYYAHEEEGGDIMIRQRDAHAWAECWIKGAGWVTIDATPGSGRPNGGVASVPDWKQAFERLQDWFANLREKITLENVLRFCRDLCMRGACLLSSSE